MFLQAQSAAADSLQITGKVSHLGQHAISSGGSILDVVISKILDFGPALLVAFFFGLLYYGVKYLLRTDAINDK